MDATPNAVYTVMRPMHGKTQRMPSLLGIEELYDITVVTELYKCFETVELFARSWLRRLASTEAYTNNISPGFSEPLMVVLGLAKC